jgi:hypothetical protein
MGLREQISSQFRVSRWIGDEAIVSCPHPDHDDRNPSAAINIRKRLWTCYSCGRGGSLDKLLGGRVSDQAVEEILVELATELAGFGSVEHGYPESWLDQFDLGGVHPYWIRRGLSEEVCVDFRLGYDFETGYATYPLRAPTGKVLGVVRRAIDERPGPKYRYPDHAPVSKTLFGYYKIQTGVRDVVVTEGALDALAMWDVGVPSVAQMGATLSRDQVVLLRKLGPTSITFAYDRDPAGNRALKRAIDDPMLDFCPLKAMIWNREDGKDPLELDPELRREVYADAASAWTRSTHR